MHFFEHVEYDMQPLNHLPCVETAPKQNVTSQSCFSHARFSHPSAAVMSQSCLSHASALFRHASLTSRHRERVRE